MKLLHITNYSGLTNPRTNYNPAEYYLGSPTKGMFIYLLSCSTRVRADILLPVIYEYLKRIKWFGTSRYHTFKF